MADRIKVETFSSGGHGATDQCYEDIERQVNSYLRGDKELELLSVQFRSVEIRKPELGYLSLDAVAVFKVNQ